MITLKIHHYSRWSLQTKAETVSQSLFLETFKISKERQNLLFFQSINAGVYAEIDVYGQLETDVGKLAETLMTELFIDKLTVNFHQGKVYGDL